MRFTPWMIGVLLAATVVLTAIALLDATAPASCRNADASVDAGLLTQAQKGYAAILDDEPGSSCAGLGMARLSEALCTRAKRFLDEGLKDDAHRVYASVVTREPPV